MEEDNSGFLLPKTRTNERSAEMERLTAISENGKAYYPYCFRENTCDGCGSSEKCDQCELSLKVCDTLAAYENTGITPPEIMELKERDTAMEINEIHVDEYYCPACGAENNCDQGVVEDNFCPRCGRRLKRRED